jgi:hypothetical protein
MAEKWTSDFFWDLLNFNTLWWFRSATGPTIPTAQGTRQYRSATLCHDLCDKLKWPCNADMPWTLLHSSFTFLPPSQQINNQSINVYSQWEVWVRQSLCLFRSWTATVPCMFLWITDNVNVMENYCCYYCYYYYYYYYLLFSLALQPNAAYGLLWLCSPVRAMASSSTRFLDHTWRATVGRTPLDEWSARHRDLYLTTHSTHNRRASLPPVGSEPTITAGKQLQTYDLDHSATGTSNGELWLHNIGAHVLYQTYTGMCCLTMGICSAKCIIREFRRANVIKCTYSNIDSIILIWSIPLCVETTVTK